MGRVFRECYDILIKVYRDNAYLNLIMKNNTNKRVAKIVYGVLDKHFELNYIINQLADRGIKPSIRPIFLIASYCLIFMDTPQNLVITETNELLESLGKSGIKDFVAAVLAKIAKKEYQMPSKSDKNYLEVKYNLPSWLVGMYRKDYPNNFEEIIEAKEYNKVHIFVNKNVADEEIKRADKSAVKTHTGYFVSNNKEISLLNFLGKISYMSYGSTLIAHAVANIGGEVLDCCAAPGGKSVYLATMGLKVTACDVHEHRVELIKSYAQRMNVALDIFLQDATKNVPKWQEKFDVVLVDAPCSGFGVISKKKDTVFNRSYEDLLSLALLQQKILQNACKYVKKGGRLVYSTCTVFKKENEENIAAFFESNKEFCKEKIDLPWQNEGEIQFLPDGKGLEGFYLCQMKRN